MGSAEKLVQGADYPSSYYAATANFKPIYDPLKGSVDCDVCIIGAGYTGLSAAVHLAEKGFKVCLLEAAKVGWGASGRNGGQIHPGPRRDQDYLEEQFGKETAKALWQQGLDAALLVKQLVEKYNIDCDLEHGLLHGLHKLSYVEEERRYVEKMQQDYGYNIRFVEKDEIRQLIATNDYHGGYFEEDGGHLHPLNYALGLADAAGNAGASIYEGSQVNQIIYGNPVKIITDGGEVSADYLLICCNGYMSKLDPTQEAHVMPINNFIAVTDPISSDKRPIRGDFAVADSRFVVNYYRMLKDRRFLFGGGENYSPKFPRDIRAFVQKYMLRKFPQLEDQTIDFGWGGTLAVTMNRMPYFAKPAANCFTAAGYSGQGVNMATFGGKVLAEAVGGTFENFDLLAKVPTPSFPGGKYLRYPGLVAGMTWYALMDRL